MVGEGFEYTIVSNTFRIVAYLVGEGLKTFVGHDIYLVLERLSVCSREMIMFVQSYRGGFDHTILITFVVVNMYMHTTKPILYSCVCVRERVRPYGQVNGQRQRFVGLSSERLVAHVGSVLHAPISSRIVTSTQITSCICFDPE